MENISVLFHESVMIDLIMTNLLSSQKQHRDDDIRFTSAVFLPTFILISLHIPIETSDEQIYSVKRASGKIQQ